MSKVRLCAGESCNNRLPGLEYDGHSLCARCIGKECNEKERCKECVFWPESQFKIYVKHRRVLQLTRARKAKLKARRLGLSDVAPADEGNQQVVHQLSPSSFSEFASPSSVAHPSPASFNSLPLPLSAASPAPIRGQVTTELAPEDEAYVLKGFLNVMRQDIAESKPFIKSDLMNIKAERLAQVHSESVPPLSQSLHSNSVVVNIVDDPGVTQGFHLLADGNLAPTGENCPIESCLNAKSDSCQDRGRKRERKDSGGRVKRSHPPSRERSRPLSGVSGVNVRSSLSVSVTESPACDVTRGPPAQRSVDDATPARGDGRFSDSMSRSLTSLFQAAVQKNPNMSLNDSFALAKEYLEKHDPTYSSYKSSRSSRSHLDVTRDSDVSRVPVLSGVDRVPRQLGIGSVEQGEGGFCHDVTSVEVHHVPTRSFSHDVSADVDQGGAVECLPLQSSSDRLVIDSSLMVLSTPRNRPASSSTRFAPADSLVDSSITAVIPKVVSSVPAVSDSVSLVSGPIPAVGSPPVLTSGSAPFFSGISGTVSHPVGSASRTIPFVPGSISQVSGTVPVVPSLASNVFKDKDRVPVRSSGTSGKPGRSQGTSKRSFGDGVFSAGCVPYLTTQESIPVRSVPVVGVGCSPLTSKSKVQVKPPCVYSSSVPSGSLPVVSTSSSNRNSVLNSAPVYVPSVGVTPPVGSRPMLSMSKVNVHSYVPSSKSSSKGSMVLSSFEVISSHEPSTGSGVRRFPPPATSPPAKKRKLDSPSSSVGGGISDSDSSIVEVSDNDSEELLQTSLVFKKLKSRIVSKYTEVKEEQKVAEFSPFQLAFEKVKPALPKFRIGSSVSSRLAALDKELEKKRSLASKVPLFQPFLKNKDLRFYRTTSELDSSAPDSVLSLLTGILDQSRVKNLKSSKVSFSLTEIDSLIKSAFHLLEVLSFSSSSFEILGECFLDLRNKLSCDLKPKALEYTSFLRCVDKAGRHSIGEAVNLFANLLIKKREHILNMSFSSVSQAFKSKLVFSPLSTFHLLPIQDVKETAEQFRRQSETSALASMVTLAKTQSTKSKSFFRGAGSGSSSSSLSYRGSSSASRGKPGKSRHRGGYSARNRDFFNKRDRFVKGSKKPNPPNKKE